MSKDTKYPIITEKRPKIIEQNSTNLIKNVHLKLPSRVSQVCRSEPALNSKFLPSV